MAQTCIALYLSPLRPQYWNDLTNQEKEMLNNIRDKLLLINTLPHDILLQINTLIDVDTAVTIWRKWFNRWKICSNFKNPILDDNVIRSIFEHEKIKINDRYLVLYHTERPNLPYNIPTEPHDRYHSDIKLSEFGKLLMAGQTDHAPDFSKNFWSVSLNFIDFTTHNSNESALACWLNNFSAYLQNNPNTIDTSNNIMFKCTILFSNVDKCLYSCRPISDEPNQFNIMFLLQRTTSTPTQARMLNPKIDIYRNIGIDFVQIGINN